MSSTGRRPMSSEMRPQAGAKTSCMSEYTAINAPAVNGVAFICSA